MWNPRGAQQIQHPAASLYQYHLGRRFDPGAMAEAFEPKFANPVFVVRGPGRIPVSSLRVLQHPQLWFAQRAGVVGLGGLVTGQIISQPLVDPAQLYGNDIGG